jgi:hypothetical protein
MLIQEDHVAGNGVRGGIGIFPLLPLPLSILSLFPFLVLVCVILTVLVFRSSQLKFLCGSRRWFFRRDFGLHLESLDKTKTRAKREGEKKEGGATETFLISDGFWTYCTIVSRS